MLTGMGVRVTLDSTLLENTPRGWENSKIKSKRDKAIKGLFLEYITDYEFWGDGFTYIDNAINTNYCQTISVLIETDDCNPGVFETEFDGIIQLTKITDYDVDKRIIKTKIFDAAYDSNISNNKSLKAYLDVGTSKNGDTISAVTPVNISFFNPTANYNSYLAPTYEGYRVFDAFKFIIDYMTDGTVGFESSVFDVGGEFYDWFLFNGKELRVSSGNGEQIEVSFKDLFKELDKKCNLSFAIEPTPSGYDPEFQLRLEQTSYFEQNDALSTLENVKDIKMKFNKDELYSDIDIGSDDFNDNVDLSYPPISFKSFREENYTVKGQCNIDKTLDLVSKFIIDSNVIEDVVINGSDKWDKKTFIVVTDGTKAIKYKEYLDPVSEGSATATIANKLRDTTADFVTDGVAIGDMVDNITTGNRANVNTVDDLNNLSLDTDIMTSGDSYQIRTQPFNYNHPLTNIEVVSRFIGGLPNSVLKAIGSGDDNFQASTTSDTVISSFPTTISPIIFADDSIPPNFDTNSNYDTVTGEYTIPNSGLYGVEINLNSKYSGNVGSEMITNGDFASFGANWFIKGIDGGTFNLNKYVLSGTIRSVGSFLKQYLTLIAGYRYVLEYDAVVNFGSITSPSGNVITETGHYKEEIDMTNKTNNETFIQFTFDLDPSVNGISVELDNISLKSTSIFSTTINIKRYSAANNLLRTFSSNKKTAIQINSYQIDDTFIAQETFSAFVGEKIEVEVVSAILDGSIQKHRIFKGSNYKTILVENGGGEILPVDKDTFPIYEYEFNKAMKFEDFKELKDNPEKAILFNKGDGNNIFGWRNSMEYDRKTSNVEFKVRSRTKINGDC
jgi:hypothetical protein